MPDFKVGDKVNVIAIYDNHPGEVVAIGAKEPVDVCVRWLDGSIGLWSPSQLRIVADHFLTPPEGREVEAEKRLPKKGDEYWSDVATPHKWQHAYDDHWLSGDKPRYCLRPLPPKPEGEGWEWRKPVKGDEYQWLYANGDVGGVMVDDKPDHDQRLSYRWCRKKPKVKRWNDLAYDQCAKPIGNVHFIDTGTGPRLDTDKIGREWAIKWLEGQSDYGTAKHFAAMLRKEQEASNVND